MTVTTEPHPLFKELQRLYDIAATQHEKACAAVKEAVKEVGEWPSKNLGLMIDQFDALLRTQEQLGNAARSLTAARTASRDAAYDNVAVRLHKADILAAIHQIAQWERHQKKVRAEFEKFISWHQERISEQQRAARTLALDDFVRQARTLRTQWERCHELNGLAGLDSRLAHVQNQGRSKGRIEEIEKGLPPLQAMLDEVAALEVAAPDVAKALKVLGLKLQSKSALSNALAGTPAQCVKRLGEIAAQGGAAGATGQQMWALLRKAGLV